mmetsp:Transcript_10167/g.13289  ORF Transcript_10167/g.13289 Transcript_10167/m.13289 type:complete len:104 (+) Transcript_10167:71-382(+)
MPLAALSKQETTSRSSELFSAMFLKVHFRNSIRIILLGGDTEDYPRACISEPSRTIHIQIIGLYRKQFPDRLDISDRSSNPSPEDIWVFPLSSTCSNESEIAQ